MSRFVEGEDRRQPVLPPSCLDDYVAEDNAARVKNVKTEISLHILAYNMKRVMQILGTGPLTGAIRT